ncbi:MAG: SDR family NAD(P)-dependent oxidoreductase [Bacteroidales bacterium]|nr:SDR family NAD(P)-dependent oxidoreductase [Bacteroidales bacterium]
MGQPAVKSFPTDMKKNMEKMEQQPRGKKTALVTGASSGMGLHYAKQLAEYGYNLLLVSNQQEQLDAVVANIRSCHNNIEVHAICKDLSGSGSAQELFDYCNGKSIEVEVLINNAGIFFFNDIIDCSTSRVSTIVNLHVYTVTMLCRLFGEKMRERRKGYILNMSSISAHTPFCGISLYTASKSYIRTMSRAFRLELKEYGVHVMTVSPGAVATDLYRLPKNLQKLGVNIGVIYRPERLVKNALKKLFFTNKREYIPGIVNRLFKPVYSILPEWFKMWARRKTACLKK